MRDEVICYTKDLLITRRELCRTLSTTWEKKTSGVYSDLTIYDAINFWDSTILWNISSVENWHHDRPHGDNDNRQPWQKL